jgi:hypothetical protein
MLKYLKRMGFTTDGRVHHSGIANEKALCLFLNTKSTVIRQAICPAGSTVEHRGGTGQKADAEIVIPGGINKTISIKHHKTGTFDWLNSSAALPNEIKPALTTGLAQIKDTFAKSNVTDAQIEEARKQVENVLSVQLKSLSSDTIKSICKNCYLTYSDYIMITNISKSELIVFKREGNLKELATFDDWTYCLRSTPRAKTSAQIWRSSPDGSVEVNTHLRLRLVLNNGVTALLGKSKANSSSTPCLKIQQDNVAGFLKNIHEPITEAYTAVPEPAQLA